MYIANAAIKYPDGEIVTAKRHYKIIHLKAKLGERTIIGDGQCVDGFVDTAGNFLTRDEAKKIAIENGQLSKDHKGTLYSEDLWPDKMLEE